MNMIKDILKLEALDKTKWTAQSGKVGYALLWLLGVPLPLLAIVYMMRGH